MKKPILAKAIPYITAAVMAVIIGFLTIGAIETHRANNLGPTEHTEEMRQMLLDSSSFNTTKIIFQKQEWVLIEPVLGDSEYCYLHTIRRHNRIGFSMVLCEHFTPLTDY